MHVMLFVNIREKLNCNLIVRKEKKNTIVMRFRKQNKISETIDI